MRYMILIYNDVETISNMTEADYGETFQAYMKFNNEANARGVLRNGDALQDPETATTVRVRDGKTTTFDGPFAETKEFLGGFYIVECDNLDEAIELSAMIPAVTHGSIEIRPIMEIPQGE